MHCITVICLAFFPVFFFLYWGKCTAGEIQGHSHTETAEGSEKDIWLAEKSRERESDREREEKEGKTGKGRVIEALLLLFFPLSILFSCGENKVISHHLLTLIF